MVRSCRVRSRLRLETDVEVKLVERKDDQPFGGLAQDAGIEQRMHVAMHSFDIASKATRRLPNGQRSGADHGEQ